MSRVNKEGTQIRKSNNRNNRLNADHHPASISIPCPTFKVVQVILPQLFSSWPRKVRGGLTTSGMSTNMWSATLRWDGEDKVLVKSKASCSTDGLGQTRLKAENGSSVSPVPLQASAEF